MPRQLPRGCPVPSANGTTRVGEQLAAAAFALEVPASDLTGYVILGVTNEGTYLVTSNACCYLAMAGQLANASAEVMVGAHGMMPCEHST